MAMKRLYEVGGAFFDNKRKAKIERDGLNKVKEPGYPFSIKLGPDHWRYGLKNAQRTISHSQKKGVRK